MLTTERLHLRTWRNDDLNAFAALCGDADVMRYFPGTLSREESAEFIERMKAHELEHGYTFWAVQERKSGELAGFTGLYWQTRSGLPFSPGLEIGWRLRRAVWRRGYATEAARASLALARDVLGIREVNAITPPANRPSIGVMRKLGMQLRGTFDHPAVAVHTGLRKHVWYGIEL